jgi:hypothetical protein
MFVQNDVLSEFIGWCNKNILENRDKVVVKFNPYKEEGKIFAKTKLFKGKPKATITLSNRIPYLEIPGYLCYELGKYILYKESNFTVDELDMDNNYLMKKVEEIVTRWNDFVDTKYVLERNG